MYNLKSWWKTGLIIAGVCTLTVGCRDVQQDTAKEGNRVTSETVAQQMSYEAFKSRVYQEPESGIYIANGDEQIGNEKQLREYYELNIKGRSEKDRATSSRSTVHTSNGVDAKWNSSQKMNLSYCVSTNFGSNYNRAVQAMASAAQSWESAAGGNINYVHSSSHDSNCTSSNGSVLFDVNPVNSGGQYLARAFFPNQGRSSRNILIDSSAFSMSGSVTLDGVIRHELGHTLGFRHEHTRPEAGTCYEDNNWRALTSYDKNSVMHYPQCNGVSGQDLNITSKDQQGVQSLYGSIPTPPLSLSLECEVGPPYRYICFAMVSGGSGGYTYQWESDGFTPTSSSIKKGLCSNIYEGVIVTDEAGNSRGTYQKICN